MAKKPQKRLKQAYKVTFRLLIQKHSAYFLSEKHIVIKHIEKMEAKQTKQSVSDSKNNK